MEKIENSARMAAEKELNFPIGQQVLFKDESKGEFLLDKNGNVGTGYISDYTDGGILVSDESGDLIEIPNENANRVLQFFDGDVKDIQKNTGSKKTGFESLTDEQLKKSIADVEKSLSNIPEFEYDVIRNVTEYGYKLQEELDKRSKNEKSAQNTDISQDADGADLEKQAFYAGLPKIDAGNGKGEVNFDEMSIADINRYNEYEYGAETALSEAKEARNAKEKEMLRLQEQLKKTAETAKRQKLLSQINGLKKDIDGYGKYISEQEKKNPDRRQDLTTAGTSLERASTPMNKESSKEKTPSESDFSTAKVDNKNKSAKKNKEKNTKNSKPTSKAAPNHKALSKYDYDALPLRQKILYDIASGRKFVWGNITGENGNVISYGLASSLFGKSSSSDRRAYFNILASPEKGGATIEQYAHQLWEESNGAASDHDILNEILDVLQSNRSNKDALKNLQSDMNEANNPFDGMSEQEAKDYREYKQRLEEAQKDGTIEDATEKDDFLDNGNDSTPFHKSQQKMNPISRQAFRKLIARLKKTGLSKDVITDVKAMREILGKKGIEAFAQIAELSAVNARFNEELQQQIEGKLPAGHIYRFGNAGAILQSVGFSNSSIELSADRLAEKASENYGHPFDISEVRDLPNAINNPLAVFSYGDKSKAVNIITEIEHNGKKFLVGVALNPIIGGKKLEVNSIRSIFPKDTNEWVNWINHGKGLYFNKEKVLDFLTNSRHPADVAFGFPENQAQQENSKLSESALDSAAKVIQEFENPKIEEDFLRMMAAWQGTEIEAFAQVAELSAVNARFNEELQQQIAGALPAGHIYKFGNAGVILQAAGLPNLPIELAASRLSDKSMQENHPFDLSEIKDLPKAIQNPIAVFRSATHIGSFVVLTEITHNGKNFVAAIEANRKSGKIEVNTIRSIYPKNTTSIATWVNEGLLEYADKELMNKRLSQPQSNSADVRKTFKDAAKVIQEFENPKIEDEKFVKFMIAYHGSPYTFDYFVDSMNGKGEGDSGWGYGTYLSKDRNDAKDYALKLATGDGQERIYKVDIPNKNRYLVHP